MTYNFVFCMQIIGFMVMCVVSAIACFFVLCCSAFAAYDNHYTIKHLKYLLEHARSGDETPDLLWYWFRDCHGIHRNSFNVKSDDPDDYISCWTAQVGALNYATIVLS